MSLRPTILFQPPNHVGLGHVNRLAAMALALHQIDPFIRTVFAVEGAAHLLLDAVGLPCIPLPSSHEMEETDRWVGWTKLERSTLATEVARSVINSLRPNIIVFDCFPAPTMASTALDAKVPIVLCLREMRELDSYLAHITYLVPHLSLVLVPHDANTFGLPDALREKSHFVGQIARSVKLGKRKNRDPMRPLILITGGGGGYPETVRFYNLALNAFLELGADFPGLQGRLITGPLFKDWLRLEPASGCAVLPFEGDTLDAFAGADLVISVAGYNTVAELQQVGTKTILIPAERMWDDQFARARRVAQTSSHFRVFLGSNPSELADLARKFLHETLPNIRPGSPAGAERAAECLRSLLQTG